MAELLAIHDEVDRRAQTIAERNADRLHCARGCCDCCVDGITVFEIEAERIRLQHRDLLRKGRPHPEGACAFLDAAGACRIYPDRPYVCRTQGLPLRWLEEDAAGAICERRDICPLNADGPPLEALPEDDCWSIGPTEQALAALQSYVDGGNGRRVALRSLFAGEVHA